MKLEMLICGQINADELLSVFVCVNRGQRSLPAQRSRDPPTAWTSVGLGTDGFHLARIQYIYEKSRLNVFTTYHLQTSLSRAFAPSVSSDE